GDAGDRQDKLQYHRQNDQQGSGNVHLSIEEPDKSQIARGVIRLPPTRLVAHFFVSCDKPLGVRTKKCCQILEFIWLKTWCLLSENDAPSAWGRHRGLGRRRSNSAWISRNDTQRGRKFGLSFRSSKAIR